MQGRLSPPIGGKIQAFPSDHWRKELATAEKLCFRLMEWTLDHEGLDRNPLMTAAGRDEIRELCRRHGVQVASVTGDNFMQAPFHRASGKESSVRLKDLFRVSEACAEMKIRLLVVPLVDEGAIGSVDEAKRLFQGLEELRPHLADLGVRVLFESDLPPAALAGFISELDPVTYGVNYDIGNSAAEGYDPEEEIRAYGSRIGNVHIKDRLLGGTTVPLGRGAARFPIAFGALRECGYQGNFILQTARAADGHHDRALCRYREFVGAWVGDDGWISN